MSTQENNSKKNTSNKNASNKNNVSKKQEAEPKKKNVNINKNQNNSSNKVKKNSNTTQKKYASKNNKNVTKNTEETKKANNDNLKKTETVQKSNKNKNINKTEVKTKEEDLIFKDTKKEEKKIETKKSTTKKNTTASEEKKKEDKEKIINSNNSSKDKKIDNKKNTISSADSSKSNKKDNKKKIEEKENKAKVEELFENKEYKRRKILFVLVIILIMLVFTICFSTVFAILGSFKTTFARGVTINGIDVSNLTYSEAKNKMEEVISVELIPEIELIYQDYTYIIKTSDIKFEYMLDNALEQAYNIGRKGSIVENNYILIKTALLGKEIPMEAKYDIEALDAIIDIIDTNIPGRVKQYSYYIEGENLIINPGIDGIKVQTEELKDSIINSIKNRDYNIILDDYDSIILDIPCNEIEADKIDAAKISEEIYTEPQNAYYVQETEISSFQIFPAKDGVSFAISVEEAQNMIDSDSRLEYFIPLTITKADIQLNDIGIEAFPYLIETFSTRYDASNHSRSENLRIAAAKINGTVLLPGEIFSFNNVVGERTVAEGYKNAKIYSNGQVVDGLAGGICQISSTLYNAVLLSNLEIVERFNHSFTTSYVAPGRDATVVYGIKDFKFKNSRNYPIKIEASVSNGVAVFSIYGIKEEAEYTVKIIPKTTQTIPYTTQTIVDASLAPGETRVSQGGASGCKVTTYKELYLNNTLISSEVLSNDVYQVMTRIVRVGPTIESSPTSETENIVQ